MATPKWDRVAFDELFFHGVVKAYPTPSDFQIETTVLKAGARTLRDEDAEMFTGLEGEQSNPS